MWMTEEEFDRLVAQAQLMPGAFSLNIAAVIGRRMGGRRGSVVAFRMGRSSKVDLNYLWVPFVVALAVGVFHVAPLYILLFTVVAGYLYGKFLR